MQSKTRNLCKVTENQPLWDSRLNLKYCEKAIKELTFWENNINFFNKKPLRAYDLPRTVIFSDASSFAIGAIFENQSRTYTCHKNLTMKERLESSTWRELLPIQYALKSFAPLLQNTSISLKTDNFVTSVIIRKGSNKTSVQEFAENINKICVENSIKFEISWIPRNNNAAADTVSKLTD